MDTRHKRPESVASRGLRAFDGDGRTTVRPVALAATVLLVTALVTAVAAALAPRAAGTIEKPPVFESVVAGDGDHSDSMSAMAVDADGTLYTCGSVWHEATGYDITVTRFGEGDSSWTITWNSATNEDDWAADIACGEDDTIYVHCTQGNGYDAKPVLLRYGPDGLLRWEASRPSGSASLMVSGKTGVYTCSIDHYEDTGRPFIRVVKYLPDGAVAWNEGYGVRGYKTETYAGDLWVSGAGNVYVAGAADGVDFVRHAFMVSWTDSGARRWAKLYDGPGRADAAFEAVAPCPGGGVYAAGYAKSDARDLLLARYAADGTRTLTKRLGVGDGHDQWASDVAVDSRGHIAVCGGWRVSNKGYYVAALRPNGTVVWAHNYAGDKRYGSAGVLVVDASDRVCVTGNGRGAWLGASAPSDPVNFVAGPVATYAFSRAGTLRWSCKWPAGFDPAIGTPGPSPCDIAVRLSSNVWVCGHTEDRPATGADQFVIGWGL